MQTKNQMILAMREGGPTATIWSDSFCCGYEIVFQLAYVAFKDSLREFHFVPKKGMLKHSSYQASLPARDNLLTSTLPNKNATQPMRC